METQGKWKRYMEGPGKWKRQMRSDCGGNSGQMERKVGGMDVCTMECLQGTDAFASYAHGKKVTDRNTAKCSADRKTKRKKT